MQTQIFFLLYWENTDENWENTARFWIGNEADIRRQKLPNKITVGIWMSGHYLYYKLFKDTPVCGHLDFNCLKLKYEVNHDILLLILAPGYIISLNKVLLEMCCFNNL